MGWQVKFPKRDCPWLKTGPPGPTNSSAKEDSKAKKKARAESEKNQSSPDPEALTSQRPFPTSPETFCLPLPPATSSVIHQSGQMSLVVETEGLGKKGME